jgi:hypothetical protein
MIAVSVGCRRSTAANDSGPVWTFATGPEPACTTTGMPASASRPHTGSRRAWAGLNPPTWMCTLNSRAPPSIAVRV